MQKFKLSLKYVLIALAVVALAAVMLIRGHAKNEGVKDPKRYGEEYAAEIIGKIQDASDVEFVARRLSYDHKSTCVVGSEARLQPAKFPVGATLIPADDSINEAIQTIVSSLALKQAEVVDKEAYYAEPPDGIWEGQTLVFYTDNKAISGIMFDMASGQLRQKIHDEEKEYYIILLYETDPSASDLLIQMLSING